MKSIYALCDENGKIRYVGCTGMPVGIRVKGHVDGVVSSKSPKAMWIRGMGVPRWFVLEECGDEDGKWREEYWIEGLRNIGYELLNVARSVDGVRVLRERCGERVALTWCERKIVRMMRAAMGDCGVPTN